MNIVICDDNTAHSAQLKNVIESCGYDTNILSFCKGADALAHITSGAKVDICFLDIFMPDIKGVLLAQEMRKAGFDGKLVFATVTNEYAVESYEVEAFSYILKPVSKPQVQQILGKVDKELKSTDMAGILLSTRSSSRFIYYKQIIYVEVLARKVYFFLTDGSTVENNMPFKEFTAILTKDERFNCCNRSYIVNMDHIKTMEKGDFVMSNGQKIPIRSTNRRETVEQYESYRFAYVGAKFFKADEL